MVNKKTLLLCSSHNDLGLIKSLKKLGYYIISTGNIKGLIGQKFVDKYIQYDYSDMEGILDIAKKEKVDSVVQCCNDFGVYTAAYVAEKLNLKGYDSYQTTCLLHNKDLFKKFAFENKLPCVQSFSFSDLNSAIKHCEKSELPIIVKPIDSSAGNGISKISSYKEIKQSIYKSFEKSRNKKIVVQRYITGQQYGLCTFLVNKKVIAYCNNRQYSFLNPYRVQIDTWSQKNNFAIIKYLINSVEKIANLLNLTDGIFHVQYIVQQGKPYIIEVMRRILGNMYGIPAKSQTLFDWDYWETRAKCGLNCQIAPKSTVSQGYFAYKTILSQKNGTIKSINIPKEYERYIYDTCFVKKSGDCITKYFSQPIGFLFMMFNSQSEMYDVLIKNYKNNMVEIYE